MKTKQNKIKILAFSIIAVFIMPLSAVRAEGIKLETPLPGQTGAIETVSGMADYLVKIYNLGLILAGVLAMGGLMIGGFLYMTASYSGNLGKMADGKSVVQSSLLGLGVALLSYLLIYTIDPRLTHPKDVFMDISRGESGELCTDGIPGVGEEETCKGYCVMGGLQAPYQYVDKCCRCNTEIFASTNETCQNKCDKQCGVLQRVKCESWGWKNETGVYDKETHECFCRCNKEGGCDDSPKK